MANLSTSRWRGEKPSGSGRSLSAVATSGQPMARKTVGRVMTRLRLGFLSTSVASVPC